ncbi:MAG: right-handed parallel beta-helix repeat-containing protein [Desulfuromonadales bacterium]|nr:right-handed parallel beta-helix repeat-containing protein [Desulfuromonadales bacterium]
MKSNRTRQLGERRVSLERTKHFLLLAASAFLLWPVEARCSELPVFPGATGFGVTTQAGRGGQIIPVTTLRDDGPGSLRAALATPGPRIIVFAVAGTIRLHSGNLTIHHPSVTIAGQSAPSPGISIRGGHLGIETHDVLVQHLRIRVGDDPEGSDLGSRDGIQILGPEAYNVVIDHCSVSWAIDENIGINGGAANITISNCIISEGLNHSLNRKGPHSKGILIGEKCSVTLFRNLLAHNDDRHPNIKGGATVVMINNFNYNGGKRWVPLSDDEGSGPIRLASLGNIFQAGPNTSARALLNVHRTVRPGTLIFLEDNIHSADRLISGDGSFELADLPPAWIPPGEVLPSSLVRELALGGAGARPRDRDAVDLRIVDEITGGRGALIDSPRQVGGWPDHPVTYRPFPLPAEPHGDQDGNGYTAIEELLHHMSAEVEGKVAPNASPVKLLAN